MWSPATDPMQIALLVDNSEAGEPHIRDYREALAAFITAVLEARRSERPAPDLAHRAGIAPDVLRDYTSDSKRLLEGAQRIFSESRRRHLPARRHHRGQPRDPEARVDASRDRRRHDRGPGAERPTVPIGAGAAASSPARLPRRHRRPAQSTRSIDRIMAHRPGARRNPAGATTRPHGHRPLTARMKALADRADAPVPRHLRAARQRSFRPSRSRSRRRVPTWSFAALRPRASGAGTPVRGRLPSTGGR